MSNFKKFTSIENSYRTRSINEIIDAGLSGKTYAVTLKVHGANFQIKLTQDTMTCGKRTTELSLEDNFYGFQKVILKYQDSLKHLQKKIEGDDFLIVYGELFGGSYNHPDVPRDNHSKSVQSEVQYCPHNDFIVFDIFRYISEKNSGEWLTMQQVVNVCEIVDLPVVPVYTTGTLQHCLEYPNLFQDDLHKRWNLPEIEGNICEGVVIKSWDEQCTLPTGERVILKNKNEKFAEKHGTKPPKPTMTPDEIEANKRVGDVVAQYINDARLRNVISKIGEVTEKDFGMVLKEFIADVRDDFFKDYDATEYGAIFGKFAGKLCADHIRPNFLNIIDNTF